MAINSSSQWQRWFLVSATLVLVVAALYFASAFLIPVVVAILLTFILSPLVSALQRTGLWRVPSVILVVLLSSSLLGGILFVVLAQFKSLAADLPKHKDEIVQKIASVKSTWLIPEISRAVKEISKEVEETGKDKDTGTMPETQAPAVTIASSPLGWIQAIASSTMDVLLSAALVVVLVFFMLIQREDLRNRIIRLWGRTHLTSMTKALDDAAQRISRFLLMQVIVNGSYGLLLGIALWLIGVPYALLWGFLAAIMRYIPYVGPLIGDLFPIAFSLVVLPGWTQPLLVIAIIVVWELISNNVLEPYLYGHSIGVSEVALLIAAAFWTWLWGPIGLVLSTPLTACLAVLGKYVPQLEFFGTLLGDEPPLETHLAYYQRLLAKDQDEAIDVVEEFLEDHPVHEVYDQVLVPALARAKDGRLRGQLSDDDARFIIQATQESLEEVVQPKQQAAANGEPSANAEDTDAEQVLVLGCPARDEMDELALRMLRLLLLEHQRIRLEAISAEKLTAEVICQIREENPAVICIATLPPKGITHTRYLYKRLRSEFPDIKILIGAWGLKANVEKARERLREAGADQIGVTLLETRDQILPLIQVVAHAVHGGRANAY